MIKLSKEGKEAFKVADRFLVEQTTDKAGFLVVACKNKARHYIHDQDAPAFFTSDSAACKFIQQHAGANPHIYLVS